MLHKSIQQKLIPMEITLNGSLNEVEKETKSLLKFEEYLLLKSRFGIPMGAFKLQINHYLMDPDQSIIRHSPAGTMLRIRNSEKGKYLQFKYPDLGGTSEYQDILDDTTMKHILSTGKLPQGNVLKRLQHLGFGNKFHYIGDLETIRAKHIHHGEEDDVAVFLDWNTFPDHQRDYEIEVKSGSLEKSQAVLIKILDKSQIPQRVTPYKFARFWSVYESMQKL